jgi:hypothetical protein
LGRTDFQAVRAHEFQDRSIPNHNP